MNIPAISQAKDVTRSSFTASWSAVTGATKYYIDVATDLLFNQFVSGYQYKSVSATSDSVTGLADLTHYYCRVRAANADDTDVSGYSYVVEVITGMSVSGISVEFGNLTADVFSVSGMTIEVSTEYNFQLALRDSAGIAVNSAECVVARDGWSWKGAWDPNVDPSPVNPNNGDYYTISAAGYSSVTGETEEFTPVDIIVYISAAWHIKKRRHVYSDAGGVANLFIDYNVANKLIVIKSGYQNEHQYIYRIAGEHVEDITMYPIVPIVHTPRGHCVSAAPGDRGNTIYL